jgi:hypothetical protein
MPTLSRRWWRSAAILEQPIELLLRKAGVKASR